MALSTIGTNSLADNAVVSSKITDATIATGDIANSAVTLAKTSGVAITEADQWRVTTNFANSSNGSSEVVASNWERADTEFDKIGTGLSESSGIFSFPSTGIYVISAIASYYPDAANSGVQLQIRFSTGGSYDTRAIALSGAAAADRPEAVSCQTYIDVVNNSTYKFAIYTAGTTASNFWRCATDRQQFGFTCIRLGDT